MSRIRLNPDGVDVVAAQDPPHGWAQVTEADTFKRYTLVFVIDREERKVGHRRQRQPNLQFA
jgi:hypothetical protein